MSDFAFFPNGVSGHNRPCYTIFPDGFFDDMSINEPETIKHLKAYGKLHDQVEGETILSLCGDKTTVADVIQSVISDYRAGFTADSGSTLGDYANDLEQYVSKGGDLTDTDKLVAHEAFYCRRGHGEASMHSARGDAKLHAIEKAQEEMAKRDRETKPKRSGAEGAKAGELQAA